MLLQLTEDDMRSLLFGDYMKPDAVSEMIKRDYMSWCRDHMTSGCKTVILTVGTKTL